MPADAVSAPRQTPSAGLDHLAIAVCTAGFACDVYEAALSNGLSAVFSAPPHAVGWGALDWLLAAPFIGAIVGAPLTGWLADRFGRRMLLAATLAVLALSSLLGAASPDAASLTLCRALSGLALGGYPPLVVSYLTDILPAGQRGRGILTTIAVAGLGQPAALLLLRWLGAAEPLGLAGWRCALLAGGGAALAIVPFAWALPESARWLAARGRPAASLAAGARPPRLLLCTLYFLTPWATTGFAVLSGVVLIQKGMSVADSLLYLGIGTFGGVAGMLAAATAADRIGRRPALVGCSAAMAAAGLTLAVSVGAIWVIGAAVAFNLFGAIYTGVQGIYAAELAPTAVRARTLSAAWAANRVGSALTPLALLPLLHAAGPVTMFALIAAVLATGIGLTLGFGPPGRAGQAVA